MFNLLSLSWLLGGSADAAELEAPAAADEKEDEEEDIFMLMVTTSTVATSATFGRVPTGTYADYKERETLYHLYDRWTAEGRWETQFRLDLS